MGDKSCDNWRSRNLFCSNLPSSWHLIIHKSSVLHKYLHLLHTLKIQFNTNIYSHVFIHRDYLLKEVNMCSILFNIWVIYIHVYQKLVLHSMPMSLLWTNSFDILITDSYEVNMLSEYFVCNIYTGWYKKILSRKVIIIQNKFQHF